MKAWKILSPAVMLVAMAGCKHTGDIDETGGITAVRSVCPSVGVPAGTGDVTVFDPATSHDASAVDVVATMTNVRSTCDDSGEQVLTNVTFDVLATRTKADAARDVTLPYFVTVVQGSTAVVAKRISRLTVHFDAGQTRAHASGQASSNVDRAAATLPTGIRQRLLKKRKAGEDDAAVDPLTQPDVRLAVLRATFETLVGFQLTDDQLKYNVTR